MKAKSFFSKNVDMTQGVIWKQILLYTIPLILGDFLQQLYSTTDSIIVGQCVGTTALAAVSSTELVITVLLGFFTGISGGATIVIAKYFGAKDRRKIAESVSTVALITVAMGILMTVIGICCSPFFLRIFETPADVYPEALTYLRIYFAGMTGITAYNMASGILRAVGDSVRPLIALGITSVVNVALDLLFVAVFHMGVAGAAYATIIAIYASAVYLIILLLRTKEDYRLDLRNLRYNRSIAGSVFGIGIPIGIQKSVIAFSNLLVIAHVNFFGSAAAAGWGIYRKLDMVVMNVTNNLSQAISTYVSQNLGAGLKDRIKKGSRFGILLTVILVAVTNTCLILLRKPIIRLFDSSPEVMGYASTVFTTLLPLQPIIAAGHAFSGKLRGYGDSKAPTVIQIFCMVVLRQIYLNLGWPTHQSFVFVLSCYPVAWTCTLLLTVLYDRIRYRNFLDQQEGV